MSYYITLCMLPSLGYSIAPKKKRHRQTEVREPRSSPQRIALARVNKLGWEGTPRWDRATGSIYDPGTRPPSGAHTRGIDRARAGILQGPDACRWGPDGRRETERRRGKNELRLHTFHCIFAFGCPSSDTFTFSFASAVATIAARRARSRTPD